MLAVLVALAHCGGSDILLPSEARPATITKADGDGQGGPVGAALEDSIVVQVVDQRGDPVVGQRVAFTPGEDAQGAQVRPEVASTNADGLAQTQWVLGPTIGAQSLTASVEGNDQLFVTFQATARAADARRIEEGGGNNQEGTVASPLPDPLEVLVTDEFGNPVEGVQVDWTAEAGSVDPTSSTTGPDGKAATIWSLGSSTGSQRATASSEGLQGSPVTFSATARAGGASRLVLISGNNQSAAPNQELDQPLVVRLEDADRNGVSDRAVSWVVGSGGGSVSASTSTTDANGEAQVRWTLGPHPGLNTLNAVVSGVGFVTFRAMANGGGGGGNGGGGGGGDGGDGDDGGSGSSTPSRLGFVVQPSDAAKNKKIEPPVQVAVLDQSGTRVTQGQFEIKLELLGDNGGKLKGHEHERTSSGVATFNGLKVDREGEYRLRATSDGLSSVDSDPFEVKEDHGHGKD